MKRIKTQDYRSVPLRRFREWKWKKKRMKTQRNERNQDLGVPTTKITTTTITITAVFPGGSKKRKSSKEDEALTGRS